MWVAIWIVSARCYAVVAGRAGRMTGGVNHDESLASVCCAEDTAECTVGPSSLDAPKTPLPTPPYRACATRFTKPVRSSTHPTTYSCARRASPTVEARMQRKPPPPRHSSVIAIQRLRRQAVLRMLTIGKCVAPSLCVTRVEARSRARRVRESAERPSCQSWQIAPEADAVCELRDARLGALQRGSCRGARSRATSDFRRSLKAARRTRAIRLLAHQPCVIARAQWARAIMYSTADRVWSG